MTDLVVAPLLVALVTAIVTLGARAWPRVQRATSVLGAVAYAAAVALLASRALGTPDPLVYQLSGWQAPFGITLVADGLSAFFLVVAALVAVPAAVFSAKYVDAFGQRVSYHPLFHFMLVGVSGSLLTGDVFNLFVWFEVMLMPSYVLVVFYGDGKHTDAALKYTALNLVGSAVMLVAIGGLYATTGTLNMAHMAQRLAAAGTAGAAVSNAAPVLGLAGLLFAVFGLKAGVVPFQFWVPSAYRAAPAPATAMLAGVTKKVGVYAMIRLSFTVFAAAPLPGGLGLPGVTSESFLAFFAPVFFLTAAGSIFLGGLGAVSRDDLVDVLSYSSIGQVGFIVLPLAVAAAVPDPAVRTVAIVAALAYSLNHAVAKALLFMLAGAVGDAMGSTRFENLGGLAGEQPTVAGAYFVGALALVGVPPLAGFFGKLFVFDAAVAALTAGGSPAQSAAAWLVLLVALAGAVFTVAYVSRAWNRAFWGDPSDLARNVTYPSALLAVLVALAATLVVVGVGFDPVLDAARGGARAALDRTGYVEAVLSPEVTA